MGDAKLFLQINHENIIYFLIQEKILQCFLTGGTEDIVLVYYIVVYCTIPLKKFIAIFRQSFF